MIKVFYLNLVICISVACLSCKQQEYNNCQDELDEITMKYEELLEDKQDLEFALQESEKENKRFEVKYNQLNTSNFFKLKTSINLKGIENTSLTRLVTDENYLRFGINAFPNYESLDFIMVEVNIESYKDAYQLFDRLNTYHKMKYHMSKY